ncbi:uncharacterized protein VTP21DRAFT_9186 [Calcarisporiella thermophila]|uniref:uncharacterized protein n=1 Tax=Calcarisporiella thermophila TaxID=911321 RepID=UPI003743AFA4
MFKSTCMLLLLLIISCSITTALSSPLGRRKDAVRLNESQKTLGNSLTASQRDEYTDFLETLELEARLLSSLINRQCPSASEEQWHWSVFIRYLKREFPYWANDLDAWTRVTMELDSFEDWEEFLRQLADQVQKAETLYNLDVRHRHPTNAVHPAPCLPAGNVSDATTKQRISEMEQELMDVMDRCRNGGGECP